MSDYVVDCDDLDPCKVFSEQKVKARKKHTCYECRHPIVPGELHHKRTCLYDGHWDTTRTCVCCEAARCAVADAYARGEFRACIMPGDLWNAVRDGLRDGWLKKEQIGEVPRGFEP